MFQQNFQLFKRTKQCFMTYILFFFLDIGYSLYLGISSYLTMGLALDVVNILKNTFSLSSFIIFLFITYEYLNQSKRCFAEECLCTLPISKNKQECMQLIICILLAAFHSICMLIINIVFIFLLDANSSEYIIYVIEILGLYLFLPTVIAILIGYLCSHFQSSLTAYCVLVILTLYFSVRFNQIYYMDETLFGLSDFTQFFCVSANYGTQYGYLFPLELHFTVKPLYIIGFLLLIVLYLFYRRNHNKCFLLGQAGVTVCIIACIIAWTAPCSGCYYGYADQESSLYNDETENTDNSSSEAFYVEAYDITLCLNDGIKANVQMTLSDETCPEYVFTLCGLYTIESISDKQGNVLDYEQDGNYLFIKNENHSLKYISIQYTGVRLNRYFAGKNGIYLPGNFPFYPLAGKHPVYYQGLCELPSQDSHFSVTIDYEKPIYSNLEQTSEHEWIGTSNNLTLISGYWKESELNGIDMIYPYVSSDGNPELNSFLMNGILEYMENAPSSSQVDYQLTNKKILISPFAYEGGHYMFGSDIIIIGSHYDLETYYSNYITTGEWHIQDSSEDALKKTLEENPL